MKNNLKKFAAVALIGGMLTMPVVNAAEIKKFEYDSFMNEEYYWGHDFRDAKITEVFGFEPEGSDFEVVAPITQDTAKGSLGVIYQNIGSYKDNQIGMKITLTDWDGTDGKVFFDLDQFFGVTFEGNLDNVKFKIEYFLSTDANKEPIPMKGYMVFVEDGENEFVVTNDFVEVYYDEGYGEIISCDEIADGTKYEFFSNFEAQYDTGLSDNAMEFTMVTTGKSEDGNYGHIYMFAYESMFDYNTGALAKVNKEEVTQGDYLKYNYTFMYPTDAMRFDLEPQKMVYGSKMLMPIDPALEVINVKAMDKNHNNITSKCTTEVHDGYVILCYKDEDPYELANVRYVEVQTKVKDNPELNPDQIVDGRYLLTSGIVVGTDSYDDGLVESSLDYDEIYEEIMNEVESFYCIIPSNVVETELYYTTKITAPHCTFSGDGRIVAATNDEVKITPDKGYYISKLVVDGEEIDVSELTKGQAAEGTFDMVNANHEIVAEVAKMPATITVNCLVAGTNEELLKAVQDGFFMTDEYEVVAPEIDGYQLLKDPYPTNTKGIVDAENIEVTFYYEQIPETGDVNVLALGLTSLTSALGIAFSKKRFKK